MPFIHEMARRSPKNYQLWNHRRRVAFKRGAEYAQQVAAFLFLVSSRSAERKVHWRSEHAQQTGLRQMHAAICAMLVGHGCT